MKFSTEIRSLNVTSSLSAGGTGGKAFPPSGGAGGQRPPCKGKRSVRETDLRKLSLFAIFVFAFSACSPSPASATSTAIIPSTSTLSPIPPTPTNTAIPSATASPAATDWPTVEAPTLEPFPAEALQTNPLPILSGFPAYASVPLALSQHDHFYFSLPIDNTDIGRFTPSQRYGVTQAADTKGEEPHLGLDLSVDSGTPVHAAAEGTIVWSGYGQLYNSLNYLDDPYGISVVIRHDFGFDGERLYTVYGHLSQTSVKVNQRVERGDQIGRSGNTGLSTGPHLHFEIRLGINNVYHTRNPELWLAPPEGYGVLVGRITTTLGAKLLSRLVEITDLDSGKKYSVYSYATQYKLLPDDYYKENFVLGNLPAGRYEIAVPYLAVWRRVEVEISSGAVTYFTFSGLELFNLSLPAEPSVAGVP